MQFEDFIKTSTRQAGALIMERYKKVGVKRTKINASDVVTEADEVVNEMLVQKIKNTFPDHGIISEEQEAYNEGAKYVWIIDPLDGTLNFATGVPMFGTMIALAEDGEVTHGAIYDPNNDAMLYAERGKGAWLNGEQVHCSDRKELENSNGIMSAWLDDRQHWFREKILEFTTKHTLVIHQLGAAAIATHFIATGRRDWKVGLGGKVWDYAPMDIVLREAGCVVTNLKGEPWQMKDEEMIVGNPEVHKKLVALLND